ncbi:MFS transporter [Streptomyces sp. NPDC048527]|uniref:MFS transporter n=1 Tax=Streptomyces sp. NPDC048527 TaxID=3365568 RepID=UPI003712F52E
MRMRPWMRVALAMFGVGWGANQFSPLLRVYRDHDGVPEAMVTAAFAAYAVGLIPTLLLIVPFSERHGRRPVMRAVLAVSALSSLVLLVGGHSTRALMSGRLLAGIASGAAFGPGTAWIKELSPGAGPGSGARRAAIPLTAGFGAGPLAAGILAQWLSAPEGLPYLAHIALMAVIAPLAWNAPETAGSPATDTPAPAADLRAVLRCPAFVWEVAPTAPLVFAAATTSFAILPGLVPVHGIQIAASGALAGLTLASGLAIQPMCRRLAVHSPHGTRFSGLAAGALGFVLAATAVRLDQPLLLIPTAIALGACYGMLLVAGLTRVDALAAPRDLAGAAAVYYCLTYLGFAAPYVVAALKGRVPPTDFFLLAALGVALLIPATAFRRHRRAAPGEASRHPVPPPDGTRRCNSCTTGARHTISVLSISMCLRTTSRWKGTSCE